MRPATWESAAGVAGVLSLMTALACGGGAAPPAPAQALAAPRAEGRLAMDGRLDEPAWAVAPVRYLAQAGGVCPQFPSWARVTWDAEAVYVGFECVDADVFNDATERDARLWEMGDALEVLFLLPGERPRKVEVQAAPRGPTLDILYDPPNQAFEQAFAWNWRGMEVATAGLPADKDRAWAGGWTAEMRLPFSGIGLAGGAAGMEWGLMICYVNAVRAGKDWTGREVSLWPAASRASTTLHEEYGRLRFVEALEAGGPQEGFARFIDGGASGNVYFPDFRGACAYRECDSARDRPLRWLTQPVRGQAGEPVSFLFVGQALRPGAGPGDQDAAQFEMWAGGRFLTRFEPFQQASRSWKGNGATLEFTHRSGRFWPSGEYRLTLPAGMAPPGRAVEMEVRPIGGGARTLFQVKGWTDTALASQCAVRSGAKD